MRSKVAVTGSAERAESGGKDRRDSPSPRLALQSRVSTISDESCDHTSITDRWWSTSPMPHVCTDVRVGGTRVAFVVILLLSYNGSGLSQTTNLDILPLRRSDVCLRAAFRS